LLYESVENRW